MTRAMFPISTFREGAIVYVDFPYASNKGKSKVRPAVVLKYNETETIVSVLKVSSSKNRMSKNRPYDYIITDLESAGLPKASVVCCNDALALPSNFKCRLSGNLCQEDLKAVMALVMLANRNNAMTVQNRQ